MKRLKIYIIAIFVRLYFRVNWNTAKAIVKFHFDMKK